MYRCWLSCEPRWEPGPPSLLLPPPLHGLQGSSGGRARLVLPETGGVHGSSVALQRAAVPTQVLAVLALDAHPPVLQELQEEVLRLVSV